MHECLKWKHFHEPYLVNDSRPRGQRREKLVSPPDSIYHQVDKIVLHMLSASRVSVLPRLVRVCVLQADLQVTYCSVLCKTHSRRWNGEWKLLLLSLSDIHLSTHFRQLISGDSTLLLTCTSFTDIQLVTTLALIPVQRHQKSLCKSKMHEWHSAVTKVRANSMEFLVQRFHHSSSRKSS